MNDGAFNKLSARSEFSNMHKQLLTLAYVGTKRKSLPTNHCSATNATDVLCLLGHKSTTNAEQIEQGEKQVEEGVITGLMMVIPTKTFR